MELRKIRFDETLAPGQIDFSDECLEQATPLRAAGTAEVLELSGGEVRVQGKYSVEMKYQCDRCLAAARMPVAAGFDLYYRPITEIERAEEVEIETSETEIGFYEGGGLELNDILREQVVLALPMQRVCSAGCKGICPVCGKNRNEFACGCNAESGADHWRALRDLGSLRRA
jgi:uncharacterized protein